MSLYHKNIRNTLLKILQENPSAIMLGEDICDPFGGCYKVTRGFSRKINGGRILNTSISESGIIGMAIGLSLQGFKPIVEIMFYDFLTLCTDQLINNAIPLNADILILTVIGTKEYGYTHSKNLDYIFRNIMDRIWHPNPGEESWMLETAFYQNGISLFVEEKKWY